MKKSTLTYSILLAALLGGTVSYAQQPADATKAPATAPTSTPGTASTSSTTTTTTTTTTTNTPSASDLMQADLLKKARSNGYHTKVRKGVVYYCKEETKIGSHFPEETCYDENGFADALQRQQSMRDSMTNHSCGNGACGGK